MKRARRQVLIILTAVVATGAAIAGYELFFRGFLPVLEIPSYLAGTPVREDIRRETFRGARLIRIALAGQGQESPGTGFPPPRGDRTVLVFPASDERREERQADPRRVGLIPSGDKTAAVMDALQWLHEAGVDEPLLAYTTASFPPGADFGESLSFSVEAVRLTRPGDPEATVSRILGVRDAGEGPVGVVLLAGEHTPTLAHALTHNARTTEILLVAELFLASQGSRLRDAGIGVTGAIVVDLAGAVRDLPVRVRGRPDIHVPTVFFRY